ncbi:hypothetical protein L7F22_048209 [Adiantum nelumboides]|nr:hypothetical protein [Adiantum nelumboides]
MLDQGRWRSGRGGQHDGAASAQVPGRPQPTATADPLHGARRQDNPIKRRRRPECAGHECGAGQPECRAEPGFRRALGQEAFDGRRLAQGVADNFVGF